MNTSKAIVGLRIKQIRQIIGDNQTEFGIRVGGIKKSTISSYEKGESYPKLETLVEIANLGKVTLDNLITGKDPAPQKQEKPIATISPGNDIAAARVREQNNRPTIKSIPLSTIVQWMDVVFEKNEQQGLYFYNDILKNYPSFKKFLERKQQQENNHNDCSNASDNLEISCTNISTKNG